MENLILVNEKDIESINDELNIAMLNLVGFEERKLDNLELIKNNIITVIEIINRAN